MSLSVTTFIDGSLHVLTGFDLISDYFFAKRNHNCRWLRWRAQHAGAVCPAAEIYLEWFGAPIAAGATDRSNRGRPRSVLWTLTHLLLPRHARFIASGGQGQLVYAAKGGARGDAGVCVSASAHQPK
jgi:hypothetical protein